MRCKVSKKNNAKNEVTLFNTKPKYDSSILEKIGRSGDMLSLTDLWKSAGSIENKDPRQWARLPETNKFIESACKFLNVGKSHIIKSSRGKGGGTFGVRQILLEYAQYLDSDLAVLVNENFFQRIEEEKNPDLIVDRAITTYKKRGYSDDWISKRLRGKGKRNEFTAVLQAHGVERDGFKNCTNAIYEPMFGGSTAVIREKKNLPVGVSIRDNLSDFELDAIYFAESLSKQTIQSGNIYGNGNCEIACRRASQSVANAIIGLRRNNHAVSAY